MALVGERPASVGRPEGLVHKSTGPSRITPRTRPGHSFPSSNPPCVSGPAVSSHCSSPCSQDGFSAMSGDVPGRTSRFLRHAQRRVHTLIRFGWPALADRVTMMPSSGRCDVPEGGTHLNGRCRGLRRTMLAYGHTPCPGSPKAPSGRPGVRCPPLRPATGRCLPAPARR